MGWDAIVFIERRSDSRYFLFILVRAHLNVFQMFFVVRAQILFPLKLEGENVDIDFSKLELVRFIELIEAGLREFSRNDFTQFLWLIFYLTNDKVGLLSGYFKNKAELFAIIFFKRLLHRHRNIPQKIILIVPVN